MLETNNQKQGPTLIVLCLYRCVFLLGAWFFTARCWSLGHEGELRVARGGAAAASKAARAGLTLWRAGLGNVAVVHGF